MSIVGSLSRVLRRGQQPLLRCADAASPTPTRWSSWRGRWCLLMALSGHTETICYLSAFGPQRACMLAWLRPHRTRM